LEPSMLQDLHSISRNATAKMIMSACSKQECFAKWNNGKQTTLFWVLTQNMPSDLMICCLFDWKDMATFDIICTNIIIMLSSCNILALWLICRYHTMNMLLSGSIDCSLGHHIIMCALYSSFYLSTKKWDDISMIDHHTHHLGWIESRFVYQKLLTPKENHQMNQYYRISRCCDS
jgi:hypothetical protein